MLPNLKNRNMSSALADAVHRRDVTGDHVTKEGHGEKGGGVVFRGRDEIRAFLAAVPRLESRLTKQQ